MQSFTTVTGVVAPLDRANVDTDALIPKQYLKSIKRSGFGVNLFDDWRYLDPGEPGGDDSKRRLNPQFILNQAPYTQANILLARENFGCGSSREHAVWALDDFGFRAVIAPSFADIFFSNSFKSGFLPIVLDAALVDTLFARCTAQAGYRLSIDLSTQQISDDSGWSTRFEVDPFRKNCLLEGLDDIGLTLKDQASIRNYEQKRAKTAPWLFA